MIVQTPPMGWNTWNTFAGKLDEKLIMETADAMVDLGYRDAGYKYVVLDDCWSLRSRSEEGELVPDPEKFPHGIRYLADYVHSKGLLLGIYSCAGVRTCANYPGSWGHEYRDARTFAEWQVDFLKYDYCNFPESADGKTAYLTMSMALRASGRDILFSACNWGSDESWNWMRSVGAHMFRSTGDIFDNFNSMADIIRQQLPHYNANAAGCFNDTDMLTVGMYGQGNVGTGEAQTYDEYVTQFAYWCASGAPLMIGGDVRSMDEDCRKLLQHKELIRINQDPECRPLYPACKDYNHPTFLRQLENNEFVIFTANLTDGLKQSRIIFPDMGLPTNSGVSVDITDVITGEHLGVFRDDFFARVPSHTCRVLRCKYVRD
ncbi:MAG: glycoside hydrolase family 27 protein [Clostridia bacterium]|nr:glycoside hydrolase family 27 protein [Clostridia bacterium]